MVSKINKTAIPFGLVLILIGVSLSFSCSKKKKTPAAVESLWKTDQNGVENTSGFAWVSKYCEKVRQCADSDMKTLDPDSEAILEKRLRKDFCLEKFKESKVYTLATQEPKLVIDRTISCLKAATEADCSSIKKGVSGLSEDCKWLQAVQNSKE
ncbi:LA_2478/LA_2722/LA_4182 family protein [Leptospira licerasiae]|uniref:LA_2478/LA_2722/LA_4182 family protein n=1 Tax=Leptospira licerasiae TaxID=447106 RepID=UPI00301925EC